MSVLDLTPDQVLATTRAVRRRLDFSRPVERNLIEECLRLAQQAPSGGNRQGWHFVVVTDVAKRQALGDLYRRSWNLYLDDPGYVGKLIFDDEERNAVQKRTATSAQYLADHMYEAPVLVIPCIQQSRAGLSASNQSGLLGSVIQAAWSFCLAARVRGLGTCWTTLHLRYEEEAAAILGIPFRDIVQVAMIPLAYTQGTEFSPAPRDPLESIVHWNAW